MTRQQQLALVEIFITEAKRRSGGDRNVGNHLAAILRETGFVITVIGPEHGPKVDLGTYEAIGGDDQGLDQ